MTTPFPLGRIQHHDPRNFQFRALVDPPPRRRQPFKRWFRLRRDVYDQGDEPSCTAQAAIGVLRTGNHNRKTFTDVAGYDEPGERYALYRAAQIVDPWPGEDYEGSSTDAPFRVLRDHGVIAGWRWLFGEEELREYVRWYGPAAIGINWYNDMFEPDGDGFIWPTGGLAGGHAISVVGYESASASYELVNSWGLGWGKYGRCRIKGSALAYLLGDGGEAATVA